ncbi:IS701 family transposase [Pacificimonas sp. ICDLI1SI03]
MARLQRAGVLLDCRAYRTKPEIALAEIDPVRKAGIRFGCVLADAGYGLSAPFRQGLSERGLAWAVGIPFRKKVHPADVPMIFPVAGRGRTRKNAIPDAKSISAKAMLETAKWRKVGWRRGTKGPLAARFAAVRVRVADGPPQRIRDMGVQHLPGEEVWLVGEHRSTRQRKYYLSNLPADTPIKQLAGAIKVRWVCEQGHQELKEELGLDHFEGRSWQGLHRHALMYRIALAFLQAQRLNQARGKKEPSVLRHRSPA